METRRRNKKRETKRHTEGVIQKRTEHEQNPRKDTSKKEKDKIRGKVWKRAGRRRDIKTCGEKAKPGRRRTERRTP